MADQVHPLNGSQAGDSQPFLYDVRQGRAHPLADWRSVGIGVSEDGQLALQEVRGGELFQIELTADGWSIEPGGGSSPLQVNQRDAAGKVRLEHLAIIQSGERVVLFLERDDPVVATSYSTRLWLFQQLSGVDGSTSAEQQSTKTVDLSRTMRIPTELFADDREQPPLPNAIPLSKKRKLIGRDPQRVSICLADVRVSGVHAWIQQDGDDAVLNDLGSTNGTFVNGEQLRPKGVVRQGDRIQIGPYTLVYRAGNLYPLSHDNNIQLVACDLIRRVPDRRNRRQTKVILDGISLVIRPKEFVCILGPSGSGKSTLLAALSARVPADGGQVLLNGEDLYTHFEILKQNLAVVPQKDVLHDVLPLNVALWYTAKLRLPADTPKQEIESRVDAILDTVNLVQRQFTPIRKLSGGQVKRASWANEAICNPSLIFLDEVTSGLDEQTDSEMMQLFRRLADEGKTIVCVTHSLSYVEQNCNLLVILAAGGVLAFVGTPAEALDYFGVSRLGDIYQRLSERSGRHWKEKFQRGELFDKHVTQRMPDRERSGKASRPVRRWRLKEAASACRQFPLLLRRNSAIQWADRRALAMMCGQSLFIALLLVWLFGDISNLDASEEAARLVESTLPGVQWEDLFPETQQEYLTEAEAAKRMDRSSKLLFLLCVSCIWFGCNNAAKEIIKERAIYAKERDVGLKVPSYYAAKLGLLGFLSGLQASMLYGLVLYFTQVAGGSAAQCLILVLSSLTGVAMGLAISALAPSEDVAVTIVPMALIPQIILAGLIAPLLHLTQQFSQVFIPAYWSYQGLLGTLDEALQQRLRDAGYLVVGSEWTSPAICGILLVYVVLFAGIAVVSLYSRGTE